MSTRSETATLKAIQQDKRLRRGPRKKKARKAGGNLPALVQLPLVIGLAVLLTHFLWTPASIPSQGLNKVVEGVNIYGWCGGFQPGAPAMFICSAIVGFFTLGFGPVAVMALLFVFRKAVASALNAMSRLLPGFLSFSIAPSIAVILFLIGWAGSHYTQESWERVGLLPNRYFPAIIGIFTWVTMQYGPRVQETCHAAFQLRDRYSMKVRLISAFAVPFILSVVISLMTENSTGRIKNPAPQEQFIVLVTLIYGYLALSPRKGENVFKDAEEWIQKKTSQRPGSPPPIPPS